MDILVAKLTLTKPDGTAARLFVSDIPVRPWPHTDPDYPNEEVENRLMAPPTYREDIHADPQRLTGDTGAGRLSLGNADRVLSWMLDCAPGTVEIRRLREGMNWAAGTPILTGRAEALQPTSGAKQAARIEVALYDARADLAQDLQPTTYAGTNAGPSGYEGTLETVKGQPKPIALGDLSNANVPGVVVNAQAQVRQLHDGLASTVVLVRSGGGNANLGFSGDLSDTAFDGFTPGSTQYVTNMGRGLVKFGAALGQEPTFDFRGAASGADGYVDTGPKMIRWLLRRRGIAETVLGPEFGALVAPAKMGLWQQGGTYRDPIELLARSFGGWCVPDPLGVWRVGLLDVPSGAPLATLTDLEIAGLDPDDPDLSIPLAEIKVRHTRNYKVMQRSEIAGAVKDTDREVWLREEWRTATWPDAATSAAIRAKWPTARSVSIDTALYSEADALALAQRLFGCFGPRADGTPARGWKVTVDMTDERLGWRLGTVLRLQSDIEGIDRLVRLMGREICSPRRDQMALRVFG